MAHILIVDDDELIAELASEILIGAGHACGWVTSGEAALNVVKRRLPDIMLLDNDMPGMSGPQVLRKLRTSSYAYDLPVVMFTAVSGAQDEDAARYNGAQDYVRKPFEYHTLIQKVTDVLQSRANRPRHRSLDEVMARQAGWLQDEPRTQLRRAV